LQSKLKTGQLQKISKPKYFIDQIIICSPIRIKKKTIANRQINKQKAERSQIKQME